MLAALAQPPALCAGAPKVSVTAELTAPESSMTSVVIVTTDGTPQSPQTVTGGKATLSDVTTRAWKEIVKATPSAVLIWTKADSTRCAQLLVAEAVAPPTPSSSDPGLGGSIRPATGDCAVDGSAWLADLEKVDPKRPKTVIVFKGSNPCYRTDTFRPAIHGDPIYLGVLTKEYPWSSAAVGFTPCDVESAVPQVLSSGEFPASLRQSGKPWLLLTALPRSCWNDAVTISIKGSDPRAQAGYVLPQYGRYRATVHLGTIFTDQHEVTFGLQQEGTQKVIVNKGPTDKGPETWLPWCSIRSFATFHRSGPTAPTRDVKSATNRVSSIASASLSGSVSRIRPSGSPTDSRSSFSQESTCTGMGPGADERAS